MPELPDVEIFKRYLDSTSLKQKIAGVSIKNRKIVRGTTPRRLASKLKGRSLASSRRHGKFLLVKVSKDSELLAFHFGMTGYLRYSKHNELPDHTRLVIDFSNGSRLGFVCRRMLGGVRLAEDGGRFVRERGLGPDALGLNWKEFKNRLAGKKAAVKSALMNQAILAGIGNVYSDEILFQSRIHPKASVHRLDDRSLRKLHAKMGQVLKGAIRYQADPQKVPKSWLLPHRGKNARCPRCKSPLKRITVNQRSTYLCPKCQKKNA